jgi:hypothetical protein
MEMEEHFLGDDIPIRFDVLIDGKPAYLSSAGVDIYDPKGRYIMAGPAKCRNGEVRFVLDGDKIEKVGIYTAIFKVTIKWFGEQSHLVKFKVKELRKR